MKSVNCNAGSVINNYSKPIVPATWRLGGTNINSNCPPKILYIPSWSWIHGLSLKSTSSLSPSPRTLISAGRRGMANSAYLACPCISNKHHRVATAAAVLNGIDYHKFCGSSKLNLRSGFCSKRIAWGSHSSSFVKPGTWWNALTWNLVHNSPYLKHPRNCPEYRYQNTPGSREIQLILCGRTITLEYCWHWHSPADFRKVLQEPLVNSVFNGYIIGV